MTNSCENFYVPAEPVCPQNKCFDFAVDKITEASMMLIGAFFKEEKPLGGINKLNVVKVGRRVHWKHEEATC